MRFNAETSLRGPSEAEFERLVASKVGLRDELRRAGAVHPLVRLVYDERAIYVEFDFDLTNMSYEALNRDDDAAWDTVIETANTILRALADSWWSSRLTWESPRVSLADVQP